jgi:cyclopropane-fatty-acyl-phospholipid synthase
VHVTSVTLVDDSAEYMRALAAHKHLSVDVVQTDFLDFTTDKPFDHAVICGVIEHIPNYRKFCDTAWHALKPGGRLYMDASATKEKYAMSQVTRAFTWAGHHTPLSLQGIIQELLYHGFEVSEVVQETRDYELTITHWAERFEEARADIIARWGEQTYRAFRIYLWGGSHAFATNRLQAYHLVAVRRPDRGPRPGLVRRIGDFLASLR